MSIKNALIEEFNSQLEELSNMEVGTDEYKITVDGVTKLADRIIDIDKIESDNATKWETQNMESELKAQQMKDEKQDRVIRHVVDILKYGSGLVVTVGAFVASMNFEKVGTLTTEGGRASLRSLLKFNL